MGNPELRHPIPEWKPSNRTPPAHPDRGIIASIAAEYIGAAMRQLPEPGEKEKGAPVRHGIVDVPGQGRVRITFELATWRHHKTRGWRWGLVRADVVTDE